MTQLEPTQKLQQPKNIVEYIKLDAIQESAERTLGAGGRQFLTSILSFANSNAAIMECEPRSVYAACLTAATLDLSVNPDLGQAYILPYKNKGVMQAQFQIGYRGFIQLADRTDKFIMLGANAVYDGQLVGFDNFSGEPTFDFNCDHTDEVIGFMAYFQLKNGRRKSSYMTKAQVEKHAKKYSQAYKKNFGPWKDDFDGMAKKTVLKLLLNKWAPLTTEMQRAIQEDQKVGDEYADNKISFNVENAAIEGQPIDEEQSDENYIVDKPKEVDGFNLGGDYTIDHEKLANTEIKATLLDEEQTSEGPITEQQLKYLVTITGKLPPELQEIEKEARELKFPGRSRKTFTKDEASDHIEYVLMLTEGNNE